MPTHSRVQGLAGVDDLLEILVAIEAFGLPQPSREPISYTQLLL